MQTSCCIPPRHSSIHPTSSTILISTLNEKRAILASWASDACAPEAAPHLRCVPGRKQPVLFDDVMEALRMLDKQASEKVRDRRLLRRSGFEHRPRTPLVERRSVN
jgi:hypothetical protein